MVKREDAEPYVLSVPEVAARLGVSARQVYDLCSRGELVHFRIGGLIRIRARDLAAYEARRLSGPERTGL